MHRQGLISDHRPRPELAAHRLVVWMLGECCSGSGLTITLARGQRLARNGGVISIQNWVRISIGVGLADCTWTKAETSRRNSENKKPCCLLSRLAGLRESLSC